MCTGTLLGPVLDRAYSLAAEHGGAKSPAAHNCDTDDCNGGFFVLAAIEMQLIPADGNAVDFPRHDKMRRALRPLFGAVSRRELDRALLKVVRLNNRGKIAAAWEVLEDLVRMNDERVRAARQTNTRSPLRRHTRHRRPRRTHLRHVSRRTFMVA